MKILCATLLFIIILSVPKRTQEAVLYDEIPPIQLKKADFRIAFSHLMKHEGYYALEKFDRGGETYCGIPRLFNKNWLGWKYVDQYKKTHILHNNDSIPGIIKWYVVDYYLNVWLNNNLYYIQDQEIANYLLDTKINLFYGGILIKKTLNQMGWNIPIDNNIDRETIEIINKIPKWEFLAKLLYNRVALYTKIAKNDPTQLVFLQHWIYRSRL